MTQMPNSDPLTINAPVSPMIDTIMPPMRHGGASQGDVLYSLSGMQLYYDGIRDAIKTATTAFTAIRKTSEAAAQRAADKKLESAIDRRQAAAKMAKTNKDGLMNAVKARVDAEGKWIWGPEILPPVVGPPDIHDDGGVLGSTPQDNAFFVPTPKVNGVVKPSTTPPAPQLGPVGVTPVPVTTKPVTPVPVTVVVKPSTNVPPTNIPSSTPLNVFTDPNPPPVVQGVNDTPAQQRAARRAGTLVKKVPRIMSVAARLFREMALYGTVPPNFRKRWADEDIDTYAKAMYAESKRLNLQPKMWKDK